MDDPFDLALEQAIVNRSIELEARNRKSLAAEISNNLGRALGGKKG